MRGYKTSRRRSVRGNLAVGFKNKKRGVRLFVLSSLYRLLIRRGGRKAGRNERETSTVNDNKVFRKKGKRLHTFNACVVPSISNVVIPQCLNKGKEQNNQREDVCLPIAMFRV